MRPEALGLRTWLLAVLAGWALLAWLLALGGLGSRVELAGGPRPVAQTLPQLPAPAPERLQSFESYAGIAARPLFSEGRVPRAFQLAGSGRASFGGELRLSGVLITPDLELATLQTPSGGSLRLRLDGPEVAGWRLLSLQPRAAVVSGPGGIRSLELHGGDGTPPPASVSPAAAAAAAVAPPPDVALPATPGAPMEPEQIEALRRRIEERRLELMKADTGTAADNPADNP